jgi:hypothetical protein
MNPVIADTETRGTGVKVIRTKAAEMKVAGIMAAETIGATGSTGATTGTTGTRNGYRPAFSLSGIGSPFTIFCASFVGPHKIRSH